MYNSKTMLEENFNQPTVLNYTNCPTMFYLETITTDTTPSQHLQTKPMLPQQSDVHDKSKLPVKNEQVKCNSRH